VKAEALANAASRLPMLGEKVARLYAQIGRDILAVRARRALPASLREFDAGLKELLAAAGTPEVRDNYRLLELLWIDCRPIAARAPSAEGAEKLFERNEEIVWVAAKGARLLRDAGRARALELLRAAGEARLQSQRIGRLHLFRGWGSRARSIASELQKANAEYRKAMDVLLAAPENGAETLAQLQLAENQYNFLSQAARRLEGARDVRPELEAVAKTCDNILEVMEGLARGYETVKA
jgi:hypothetical protein